MKALLGALAFLSAAVSAQSPDPRDWTVEDSVRIRYFGIEGPTGYNFNYDHVFVPSPAGTRFFTVSRAGDLSCDCNVYTLSVFDAAVLERTLKSSARRASW